MYRVTKLGNQYYAHEVALEFDIENINVFVEEGTPVILVDDLQDAADLLDIDISDIEIV